MNNENKRINRNLISLGKEIISSPSNTKMLTIITEREKEPLTELNNKSIKSNYNMNSFRNSNFSTLSNNKKTSYLNISKLNYKDGVILKDASNSNPGFGLWSIKLTQSLKNSTPKKEEKISTLKYNNDRKLNIEIKEEASDFQDNDINIFDTLENLEEDQVEKMMISKLTKRNKKLEKRYQELIINYYDKENNYLSLEKARKEYEKLINDSIKEKKEAETNLNNLDNNNQALIVSISSSRKEIERLIDVIKESQLNMKKQLEEYNNILLNEEEKRKKIINSIRSIEKQINIFREKIEENEGKFSNDNYKNQNNITNRKLNEEIDIKINKKKEYIIQLQKQLEELKIIDQTKQKEKNELLLKIKEKNDDKKNNIKIRDKIFKQLETQERNNKWNEQSIKIRDNIIYSLQRNSKSK
jgi:hypothetical protein